LLKFNSFLFGVWPFVPLKYQLLPFWGLPVCTLPDIDSFLFGVCQSVLCQILTPSFLVEIVRCSSVPLHHNPIFHLPLPWVGMYSAKRARMYPAIKLNGLSTSRWIEAPTIGSEYEGCLTWAGMIPTIFPLLGRDVPGHTPTSAPLGS